MSAKIDDTVSRTWHPGEASLRRWAGDRARSGMTRSCQSTWVGLGYANLRLLSAGVDPARLVSNHVMRVQRQQLWRVRQIVGNF